MTSLEQSHKPAPRVLHRLLTLAGRHALDARAWLAALAFDDGLLTSWAATVGGPLDLLPERSRFVPSHAAREWLLAGHWFDGDSRDEQPDALQNLAFANAVTECLADALGMPEPTGIRLRVAIARTGRDCGDRLVADLCRFADARAEDLDDAHPILRLSACVAALRDGRPNERARLLSGMDADRFELICQRALQVAATLIDQAGLSSPATQAATAAGVDAAVQQLRRALACGPWHFDEPAADVVGRVIRGATRGATVWLPAVREGLLIWAEHGLAISVGNQHSAIAAAARGAQVVAIDDAASKDASTGGDANRYSVIDRQVLARLGHHHVHAIGVRGESTPPAALFGVFVTATGQPDGLELSLPWLATVLGSWMQRSTDADLAARQERALAIVEQQAESYRIAAEANNALAIAQNYLHVLRLADAMPMHAPTQLAVIVREVSRASELLDPMARVGNGETAARPPSLAQMVEQVVSGLAQNARQAACTITLEVAARPDLFPHDGLRSLLEDVLRQLATDCGAGGTVHVLLAADALRDLARCATITINGVPAAAMARGIDDTASGLSHQAAQIGCHVDLESGEGRTTVRIWVPLPVRGSAAFEDAAG